MQQIRTVHIRQTTPAHDTTITCSYLCNCNGGQKALSNKDFENIHKIQLLVNLFERASPA